MNRIFSDDYSPYLPPDRQGEAAHRYICGLYHCMDVLTNVFRIFYLKAVRQAATALTSAFCVIFRKSGQAIIQMRSAARRFRTITLTAIRRPCLVHTFQQARITRHCAARRLKHALPWRLSGIWVMNVISVICPKKNLRR